MRHDVMGYLETIYTNGLNLHLDLVQVNNGCYVGYVMVFTMAGTLPFHKGSQSFSNREV